MATRIYPVELYGKENYVSNWQAKWNTEERTTVSGRRRTLSNQLMPNWTIYLRYPHLTTDQMQVLLGFFNGCRGAHKPFFYKDYERHYMENQTLALNTATGKYRCVANYSGQGFLEPVFKVENLRVFVDGVETTAFTEKDGEITLNTAGKVTATYDYYIKCYFKDDNLTIRQNFINSYSVTLNLGIDR